MDKQVRQTLQQLERDLDAYADKLMALRSVTRGQDKRDRLMSIVGDVAKLSGRISVDADLS